MPPHGIYLPSSFSLKAYPQVVQAWGRSPEWVRMCTVRWPDCEKAWPQVAQALNVIGQTKKNVGIFKRVSLRDGPNELVE